eukprot:scaffold238595_cov30-Prasinocladus_malaysianus.AAC.1
MHRVGKAYARLMCGRQARPHLCPELPELRDDGDHSFSLFHSPVVDVADSRGAASATAAAMVRFIVKAEPFVVPSRTRGCDDPSFCQICGVDC